MHICMYIFIIYIYIHISQKVATYSLWTVCPCLNSVRHESLPHFPHFRLAFCSVGGTKRKAIGEWILRKKKNIVKPYFFIECIMAFIILSVPETFK